MGAGQSAAADERTTRGMHAKMMMLMMHAKDLRRRAAAADVRSEKAQKEMQAEMRAGRGERAFELGTTVLREAGAALEMNRSAGRLEEIALRVEDAIGFRGTARTMRSLTRDLTATAGGSLISEFPQTMADLDRALESCEKSAASVGVGSGSSAGSVAATTARTEDVVALMQQSAERSGIVFDFSPPTVLPAILISVPPPAAPPIRVPVLVGGDPVPPRVEKEKEKEKFSSSIVSAFRPPAFLQVQVQGQGQASTSPPKNFPPPPPPPPPIPEKMKRTENEDAEMEIDLFAGGVWADDFTIAPPPPPPAPERPRPHLHFPSSAVPSPCDVDMEKLLDELDDWDGEGADEF